MVDWVSLSISLTALSISSLVSIISLIIAWKTFQIRFQAVLKADLVNENQRWVLAISNVGRGVAYLIYLQIVTHTDDLITSTIEVDFLESKESATIDLKNIYNLKLFNVSHEFDVDNIQLIIINYKIENGSRKKVAYWHDQNTHKLLYTSHRSMEKEIRLFMQQPKEITERERRRLIK